MYLRGQLSKRTCNIKVVIDTSGSVVNLAGYFFSEIEKIFKDFPVIEVAEVDTEVRRTYKMDKRTNLTEAEGGGGTILEPGIKHFSTSKKDKADVIIIFTDGYCESHIDNPKVPLIWVVLDNANNLNTNPYYGEIIVMDTSKIKQ
jgi:predicted metal-dependent peptidase